MANFHINSKGEPGVCRAQHSCPFGAESDHYPSSSEARQAYEAKQGGSFGSKADALIATLDPRGAKGVYGNFSTKDILSASTKEWAEALTGIQAAAAPIKARKEFIVKEINSLLPIPRRATNKLTESQQAYFDDLVAEQDALRKAYWPFRLKYLAASEALFLSTPRFSDGHVVPPGSIVVNAVFDLDGKFIALANDTYFSPQTITLEDGSKLKYRASQAEDPEVRARNDAKKGYFTGTVAVPAVLAIAPRKKTLYEPDRKALKKNPALVMPLRSKASDPIADRAAKVKATSAVNAEDFHRWSLNATQAGDDVLISGDGKAVVTSSEAERTLFSGKNSVWTAKLSKKVRELNGHGEEEEILSSQGQDSFETRQEALYWAEAALQ